VHRYLRDVVRLDPDRALSQRLRDQLAHFGHAARSHLVVAHAPSIRLLRPLEARGERPPVERPHALREAAPETVSPEDERLALDALVRALLGGQGHPGSVSERILPDAAEPLDATTRAPGGFVTAVAPPSAKVARVERPWERVWQSLGGIEAGDVPIEVRS
jgi:chromosome partition protein MukF